MKLARFQIGSLAPRVGVLTAENELIDLSAAGIERLTPLLEQPHAAEFLQAAIRHSLPRHSLDAVRLLTPVERQEVWAVGVTYIRSKTARMEESEFSASAYDKVYEAERPELFFKALPDKVSGSGQPVAIRRDGRWNVPEPELALVLNSQAHLVAFTIGNDMSSRDIEGENLLYLPQAKIYDHSCAVGPVFQLGADEKTARQWQITLEIVRAGQMVFSGSTSVNQIKRQFSQLIEFLFRSQSFPHGAVLLTGTGIVPPDDFTLHPADRIRIHIDGIGLLENDVIVV